MFVQEGYRVVADNTCNCHRQGSSCTNNAGIHQSDSTSQDQKSSRKKVAYINTEPIMVHFTVNTFNTLFRDQYHLNRQSKMRVYDINELQDVVRSANTRQQRQQSPRPRLMWQKQRQCRSTFNMVETTNFNPATLDWIIFDLA
jgi:hypothetical protein